MRLHPLTVVGLGVSALVILGLFAMAGSVSAQQPRSDTIDIEYNAAKCEVSVDWTDGTQDSTLLEVSVQTGAVVVDKPDIDINDVVGDQSQTLSTFTVAVGTHTVRATLYSGEKELDEDLRVVECVAPTPTPTATAIPPTATPVPATATPAPTATPVVVTEIVRSDTFAFCSNGTVVNLTKGERCPVVPQQPIVQATPIVPQAPSGSIRPPSTGDGGLVNWGPRLFDNDPAGDAYWRVAGFHYSALLQWGWCYFCR